LAAIAFRTLPQKIKPNQTMFQLEIWFEMIAFNFSITLTLLQICNACHYFNFKKLAGYRFITMGDKKGLVLFPTSFWL
jgi:hypothetical protein